MSALRSIISRTSTTSRSIRPTGLLNSSTIRLSNHGHINSHINSCLQISSVRYESQSAFGKFVETFKEQIKKNRELQESMKKLQDESGKAGESETLKKAKEAFEKAKVSQ
jgi:import inner membrane translocase subunit TIM44